MMTNKYSKKVRNRYCIYAILTTIYQIAISPLRIARLILDWAYEHITHSIISKLGQWVKDADR